MSLCCFPKISCLKSKNKVQSASETSPLPFSGIRSNGSLSRLKKVNQSNQSPLKMNKSVQDLSKISKGSRVTHKSMIAMKNYDKFEPLKVNINYQKEESFNSISISKISEVYVSENSIYDILAEIKLEEKKIESKNKLNPLEPNSNFKKEIRIIKREPTPMFVKAHDFKNNPEISKKKILKIN